MQKKIARFAAVLTVSTLFAAVAAGAGCSPSAASLCNDFCTCERCTDNDLKQCKDDADKAQSKADAAGCSSEFSDFVVCLKDHVSCKSSHVSTDGCDAEEHALDKCEHHTSVVTTGGSGGSGPGCDGVSTSVGAGPSSGGGSMGFGQCDAQLDCGGSTKDLSCDGMQCKCTDGSNTIATFGQTATFCQSLSDNGNEFRTAWQNTCGFPQQ
jgi:hypothetical protein